MIILMGMPGVGKSSVLNKLKEKKPEYKILNYGDLMFEVFQKEYGIQNRDEIRKAPISQQKTVQKIIAFNLSKMQGKIILDTHCAIRTPKGYLPGLPFDLLKELTVEQFVFISASVDEIYNRRKNDATRIRKTNKNEIIEHLELNKNYLASYSAFKGAPAIILMNKEGKLLETVDKLVSILE